MVSVLGVSVSAWSLRWTRSLWGRSDGKVQEDSQVAAVRPFELMLEPGQGPVQEKRSVGGPLGWL